MTRGGKAGDHLALDKVYRATSLDQLRRTYDDWAPGYDRQIVDDYGYRGHELVVARVRPLLADDAVILDAGAGSGIVGVAARAAGFAAIDAMDLSPGMLEIARRRGVYRNLRTGVLGAPLDYATASYDAVLSSGVFTPGHAPPSSFDELVRIVKPAGLICFTMRHDWMPEGFEEAFERLAGQGRWKLVDKGDPFHSMPGGAPGMQHRVWLFQVLRRA